MLLLLVVEEKRGGLPTCLWWKWVVWSFIFRWNILLAAAIAKEGAVSMTLSLEFAATSAGFVYALTVSPSSVWIFVKWVINKIGWNEFYFSFFHRLSITPLLHYCDTFFLHNGICKVVIYNYILCWLYFMTNSVVITLIYFLVFCEILLYWV